MFAFKRASVVDELVCVCHVAANVCAVLCVRLVLCVCALCTERACVCVCVCKRISLKREMC